MKRKRKRGKESRRSRRFSRSEGNTPIRSPFGCTGGLAAYFLSIPFPRESEEVIGRAIELARQLALQKGEAIDANEAWWRIVDHFIDVRGG